MSTEATFPLIDDVEPILESGPVEGTALERVEDACEHAKSLLLPQFRGKPRLEALLCALTEEIADLEGAIWDVFTKRWLTTAEGVQLDLLGGILDLPRAGWGDDTYRALLAAWILVLRSEGTRPDLLRILEAMGVTLTLTSIAQSGTAAFIVTLGEVITVPEPADIFRFIDQARGGGIRFDLEFPVEPVDDTFMWADGDVDQPDAARGWADDGSTLGGHWADVLSTEGD